MMISRSLRTWCFGIALSFMSLGLVNNANAAFLGDTVTVSMTVHTVGATDQTVWTSDVAVIGYLTEFAGYSAPAGAPVDSLLWNLDFDPTDCCFTLKVEDVLGIAPTTVDPLTLTIVFDTFDVSAGVVLGVPNLFGFLPGDITVIGTDTIVISVPAGALAGITTSGPLGSLATEFCIVPEVSSVTMMALAASTLAGGMFWRRRRSS